MAKYHLRGMSMSSSIVERRLAAIIAMDVVGYSRLIGADEVGTLLALKAHRVELLDPTIKASGGRVVKTTGDGLLLEFASIVDAISCAVAIQKGMLVRNTSVPESEQVVFRIGVNIGDIIVDGDDILGDGVNVAARLEALCEPGGVYISRAANEQIRDKLRLSFADLGEHTVKNIARAIGVFGLAAKDIAALPEPRIQKSYLLPSASNAQTVPLPVAAKLWKRSVAAGLVAVTLLVSLGVLWWFRNLPITAPPTLASRLLVALEKHSRGISSNATIDQVSVYAASPQHRAFAAPRGRSGVWHTSNWPSREIAEEKVLEKCLQFFDEPCALIAADDGLTSPGDNGTWPARDAPRVRYAGPFNPERIPALRQEALLRAEVTAYATITGPKAAAFHATGILTLATGAANQGAAEEKALRDCNSDPARSRSGGPCYLYAVENRVVLPLRLTSPMTAALSVDSGSSRATNSSANPTTSVRQSPADIFRAALSSMLEDLAPAMPDNRRLDQIKLYHADTSHKALAAHPPADSWRSSDWPSESAAEQNTLEACQMRYGRPCILVVINDKLQDKSSNEYRRLRSMPRVAYEGAFDAQQIPFLREATRQRQDVANYRKSSGPKAMAVHPWGRAFIATGAASQRAAEIAVLADCNNDPSRNGKDGPCWLYAVDDQVVLPKRLKDSISAP